MILETSLNEIIVVCNNAIIRVKGTTPELGSAHDRWF